jgi:hypothetical protein
MGNWVIINNASGMPLNEQDYPSEQIAIQSLQRLGVTLSRLYGAIPLFQDQHWYGVLREGFKAGDLDNILLPQFSIDIYVPSDPNTDNIVVGFLIKGVPEAVFPFRQFLSFCRGVKHVDYGDSDTLPHTALVYVEFDRDHFHPDDLDDMIDQVCRISGFESDDFAVSFPNSNKTFPYSKALINEYFEERSQRKNQLAQDKAIHRRTQQLQQELEHEMHHGNIGKMLGGPAAQAAPPPSSKPGEMAVLDKLQKLKTSSGSSSPDIPDPTQDQIIQDAKRNHAQHTETWEQFDTRWASRIGVERTKVSSIRKRIYDR